MYIYTIEIYTNKYTYSEKWKLHQINATFTYTSEWNEGKISTYSTHFSTVQYFTVSILYFFLKGLISFSPKSTLEGHLTIHSKPKTSPSRLNNPHQTSGLNFSCLFPDFSSLALPPLIILDASFQRVSTLSRSSI